MNQVDWDSCISGPYLNVPSSASYDDLKTLPESLPQVTHISAPLFGGDEASWDLLLLASRFPNAVGLVAYESTFGSPQLELLGRFPGLMSLNCEGCRNLSKTDNEALTQRFPDRPRRY